jgi:hypothetical protein
VSSRKSAPKELWMFKAKVKPGLVRESHLYVYLLKLVEWSIRFW